MTSRKKQLLQSRPALTLDMIFSSVNSHVIISWVGCAFSLE